MAAGSLRWDIQFRDPNAPSTIEMEYVDPETWENGALHSTRGFKQQL